jgi:hypothetical protein
VSLTIDKCIIKEVSQLQRQCSEARIILLIDMNAVMGLLKSRKNAFEFAFVAHQSRDHFILLHVDPVSERHLPKLTFPVRPNLDKGCMGNARARHSPSVSW